MVGSCDTLSVLRVSHNEGSFLTVRLPVYEVIFSVDLFNCLDNSINNSEVQEIIYCYWTGYLNTHGLNKFRL